MAHDTGGSDRASTGWILDTFRRVNGVLWEASTPRELGESLPDAVVSTSDHRFAWIGTAYDDGVRVRSLAGDTTVTPLEDDVAVTLTLTNEGGSESRTARVERTGEVHVQNDSGEIPETSALREYVDVPGGCTVASIPLAVDDRCDGVLHLYTDETITAPPVQDVLEEIGTVISKRLRSLEIEMQLERERDRLETFRSLISHDLGSPLNIAAGRLELARNDCESGHLDDVEGALNRLEELTDRGVEFVEAGMQPETRETISLESMARTCWKDVGRGRGTLEVDDVEISADRQRFHRLLNELIRNAFVHNEGEITVSLGPLPGGAGFYVEDTGTGIPEDERGYVFDLGYTTADGRDGLGLTIVSEIAGTHDWKLSIAETGRGARFEVRTDEW